jgi:hypothetical protein
LKPPRLELRSSISSGSECSGSSYPRILGPSDHRVFDRSSPVSLRVKLPSHGDICSPSPTEYQKRDSETHLRKTNAITTSNVWSNRQQTATPPPDPNQTGPKRDPAPESILASVVVNRVRTQLIPRRGTRCADHDVQSESTVPPSERAGRSAPFTAWRVAGRRDVVLERQNVFCLVCRYSRKSSEWFARHVRKEDRRHPTRRRRPPPSGRIEMSRANVFHVL